MKKIIVFLLIAVFAQAVFAKENTENDKITSSGSLILQFSSLPEVKLGFSKNFVFPFLQGEHPLTESNNIALNLTAEISPISLNGIIEAIWTPVAFFQFAAGSRIGSGWNAELFGNEIIGIGLNREKDDGSARIDGSAFDGLFWQTLAGAVLQMDLGAIFPGAWNHVVFRTYHEINYKVYTRARAGQSWFFENDDGENINGFNYYGNFLIGYQMPLFLNFAALMAEADLFLYDTPNRSRWGGDRIRWTFSNLLNFSISDQFSAALITQFRTRRNFLEPNWEDLFYRNRTLNNANPQRLEFHRLAAVLTYRF